MLAWHIFCQLETGSLMFWRSKADHGVLMGVPGAIVSSPALLHPSDQPVAVTIDLGPRYLFYRYTYGENADSQRVEDQSAHKTINNDNAREQPSQHLAAGVLPGSYSWTTWRPRIWPALPRGLSGLKLKLRFLFRWALYRAHLFGGSECGALLVYEGERLAHYSSYTPRYWRFPFLADDDLQVGDTWTDPAYRGRGLALFALQTLEASLERPNRRLWYVVGELNQPSIRVAEKAHFKLAAEGTRVTPWRLKLAQAYVMRRPCGATAQDREAAVKCEPIVKREAIVKEEADKAAHHDANDYAVPQSDGERLKYGGHQK
jgi:RimJ/RimL family protein N-acetyltransferase